MNKYKLKINKPVILFWSQHYLHIALGDGGGADDNQDGHGAIGNGQDPTTLLGSILRIDPAGSNSANGHYGIPADNPFEPVPVGVIDPLAQYDHSEGLSIIGGFVYQGNLLPAFRGHYLFGDFGTSFGEPSGALLAMTPDGSITRLALGLDARALGGWVKGFGQDASGEIFLCTSDQLAPTGSGGQVWRFIPLVHLESIARTSGGDLRIVILADQEGGTVELKKSTDLTAFPETVPLTPLAPSRFEATVPATDPKAFFCGELNP